MDVLISIAFPTRDPLRRLGRVVRDRGRDAVLVEPDTDHRPGHHPRGSGDAADFNRTRGRLLRVSQPDRVGENMPLAAVDTCVGNVRGKSDLRCACHEIYVRQREGTRTVERPTWVSFGALPQNDLRW